MSEDSEAEAADRSRRISRRSLLLGAGGVGLAAAGFVAGAATGVIKLDPAWRQTMSAIGDLPTPSTSDPASGNPASGNPVVPVGLVTTTVAKVYSPTSGGNLNMVAFLPGHIAPAKLPVVLLLPGIAGDPRRSAPGLSEALATQSGTGGRPFAVVALQSAEDCWHQERLGSDPMDVLINELPAWLSAHELGGGAPVAVAGVGMGGFDALLYARRRNERDSPVHAVAAIAPGLATSWSEISGRHAFLDAAQWESLDPLRHVSELGHPAIGVWCGDRDTYRAGIEEFVKLAHPQLVETGRPGQHGTTLAGVLRFLGRNLPAAIRG
ncbi:MAG TPA: alpha/beta hydrolase-fold protein [Pseudonocardiaceae bacterium]|jgi:pimeloyl-ACP methyl ester carboxylesterase|nr:alpha/beta hydrolase-fold protein [Pseudonocardiaceae bacterium]